MSRRILNSLWSIAPKPVQHFLYGLYENLPYNLRYGAEYRKTLQFLKESQLWSQGQLEQHQIETLRFLVGHAMTHVPFYKRLYSQASITATDIKELSDISKLPFISKEDIRAHLEDFKVRHWPKSKFQYHTTGGSTAKPLGLYWESDRTVPMERAFMKRQFGWIGYDPEKDRVVNIRGVPPKNGQLSEMIGTRVLNLSSYQMTPSNLDHYLELISDFKPVAVHAYPSAALIIAQHMLKKGQTLPTIKNVLCGSEQLFDWQRSILETAFQCRIYSWYGQSEYVSLAGGCEHSNEYHFYSEYGISEIITREGLPANPGESGEIVATSFLNYAFPLIRYRTGDIATISTIRNCPCERNYSRATRIDGRIQEMIVSRSGNLISMTAINMHDDLFDNVYQFQFQQQEVGELLMRIVRKEGYSDKDTSRIIKALEQKLGTQFDIEIEFVEKIERTQRGKFRFLIQELDIPQFQRSTDD